MTITDKDVKLIRRMVAATVVSWVLIGLGAYWVWTIGNTNRDALCTIRQNAELNVQASEQFLQEHPAGIPGISAASLEASIARSKLTVTGLSDLSCSYVIPPL